VADPIGESSLDLPYDGDKHLLTSAKRMQHMHGEARTYARARALPSMLSKCLSLYGKSKLDSPTDILDHVLVFLYKYNN
jgi:hypothetical protein